MKLLEHSHKSSSGKVPVTEMFVISIHDGTACNCGSHCSCPRVFTCC